MLRRLHPEQPESFAFTPANLAWAEAQITKYPEGRQASAIIPLLWRAQEQEGWLSRPAMEQVADMLGMAHIRALEVATFYFMFQLQPVGSVAHVQVCGTTACMICGAEDLIGICRKKIAEKPHEISGDGKFSWEEVECLGACTNAPMVQIGKDFYEDLTTERLGWILDELAEGRVPQPGPQNGRKGAEPLDGPNVLTEGNDPDAVNGSVGLALAIGDTVKRIDGTEVPLLKPWTDQGGRASQLPEAKIGESKPATRATERAAPAAVEPSDENVKRPVGLDGPGEGRASDLKSVKGVGPKLEGVLNSLGIYHLDQIAAWSAEEVSWMDQNLDGFKGRVSRDDWVGQARAMLDQKD